MRADDGRLGHGATRSFGSWGRQVDDDVSVIGYLVERFLVWMVKTVANLDVPFTFPRRYLALTLTGTITLALVIALLPIRRATRYRPGDALRYGLSERPPRSWPRARCLASGCDEVE